MAKPKRNWEKMAEGLQGFEVLHPVFVRRTFISVKQQKFLSTLWHGGLISVEGMSVLDGTQLPVRPCTMEMLSDSVSHETETGQTVRIT